MQASREYFLEFERELCLFMVSVFVIDIFARLERPSWDKKLKTCASQAPKSAKKLGRVQRKVLGFFFLAQLLDYNIQETQL